MENYKFELELSKAKQEVIKERYKTEISDMETALWSKRFKALNGINNACAFGFDITSSVVVSGTLDDLHIKISSKIEGIGYTESEAEKYPLLKKKFNKVKNIDTTYIDALSELTVQALNK